VIEAEAPRQTSTEQIEAAINRIRGKRLPQPEELDDDSEPPKPH
jgi:hypothetical protein